MGAEEPGLSRKQFTCRGHVFEIWGDGYFRVRVCLEELPLLEPGRGEGARLPRPPVPPPPRRLPRPPRVLHVPQGRSPVPSTSASNLRALSFLWKGSF